MEKNTLADCEKASNYDSLHRMCNVNLGRYFFAKVLSPLFPVHRSIIAVTDCALTETGNLTKPSVYTYGRCTRYPKV